MSDEEEIDYRWQWEEINRRVGYNTRHIQQNEQEIRLIARHIIEGTVSADEWHILPYYAEQRRFYERDQRTHALPRQKELAPIIAAIEAGNTEKSYAL